MEKNEEKPFPELLWIVYISYPISKWSQLIAQPETVLVLQVISGNLSSIFGCTIQNECPFAIFAIILSYLNAYEKRSSKLVNSLLWTACMQNPQAQNEQEEM